MGRREHFQVLTFLEEARRHGIAYAEHRAHQRLAMGWLNQGELFIAASEIEQRVEQKYSFYHWWYFVVIGFGFVALPLYLGAIVSSRVPATFRMVSCVIFPAIIIFIRVYAGYLQGINESRRLFRAEMEAFWGFISRETGKD